MLKCQFCQTTHVINTIFCNECGYCLLDKENRETDHLDVTAIAWRGGPSSQSQALISDQQPARPTLIRLKIGDKKREVEFPFNKFVYLGRMDPTVNIFPEIDLTPDGEAAKSVSRRHAGIFSQSGAIIIEDLASRNGTFINGNRLVPYLPEALHDGDILQLGQLLIEVYIQTF